MPENLRILREVTDQFDHELYELVPLVVVDGVGKAILNRRNFWLMYEVPVQLGLTGHVTKRDAS